MVSKKNVLKIVTKNFNTICNGLRSEGFYYHEIASKLKIQNIALYQIRGGNSFVQIPLLKKIVKSKHFKRRSLFAGLNEEEVSWIKKQL